MRLSNWLFVFTAQPHHDPNTHHCLCGADGKMTANQDPLFMMDTWSSLLRVFSAAGGRGYGFRVNGVMGLGLWV